MICEFSCGSFLRGGGGGGSVEHFVLKNRFPNSKVMGGGGGALWPLISAFIRYFPKFNIVLSKIDLK